MRRILTIQRKFPSTGETKQLNAMKVYIDWMSAYTREHELPTLKHYFNHSQCDESPQEKKTQEVDH
jgi:hypothetical protein